MSKSTRAKSVTCPTCGSWQDKDEIREDGHCPLCIPKSWTLEDVLKRVRLEVADRFEELMEVGDETRDVLHEIVNDELQGSEIYKVCMEEAEKEFERLKDQYDVKDEDE